MKVINDILKFGKRNLPSILTGLGIAGFAYTVVLACHETAEANARINDKCDELDVNKLSVKDWIFTVAPVYWPAALAGTISAGSIIAGNTMHLKNNAAVAGICALTETALKEYKEEAIKAIGEKKAEKIEEKVLERRIETNPPIPEDIYYTNLGNTLCYDAVCGRYFKHDISKIEKSINLLNTEMINTRDYVTLNDYYQYLSLPVNEIGDYIGWNIKDGPVELKKSSILTPDGEPCLCLSFQKLPDYDFNNYWS